MSTLSTHVLDTSAGTPARGMHLVLEEEDGDLWTPLGQGHTDDDGRLTGLYEGELPAGTYRLRFDIGGYFAATDTECFYPYAHVVFRVQDGGGHYHVPLLVSPFGYSTYRGS